MDAKLAHEAEVNDLETFAKQTGSGNSGSPIALYIKQRREELGVAFMTKEKLSVDDQARLEEVDSLENFLNRHNIGTDNPDQPMRTYVRQRRAALLAQPVVPEQPVVTHVPRQPVPAGTVTPAPTFSPSGGKIPHGQLISIADTVVGAAILYTVDGSIPTPSGLTTKRYTAPFTLPQSGTINAIATAAGYANSPASSVSYSY
jgi:hypothetical protein